MKSLFANSIKINRLTPFVLVAVLFAAFIHKTGDYIIKDTFFFITVISLVATFKLDRERKSYRFLLPFLLIGVLNYYFNSTFGKFILIVFASLFIIEGMAGRLSWLTLLHLLLLSPLYKYLISLINFPLRLKISSAVGYILQQVSSSVHVSGNLIEFNGREFLVDQACMGLYMISYSFLFGLAILSLKERKENMLRMSTIAFHMGILLLLNLFSNLIRATFFVAFNIKQESWLHEGFGLLIFFFYILLPFYFIVRKFANANSQINIQFTSGKLLKYRWQKPYQIFINSPGIVVFITCLTILLSTPILIQEKVENHVISGLKRSVVFNNIQKFSNEKALVYIKPPVPFYRADHNPSICWEGSGYSFRKINKQVINEQQIYIAELEKDGTVLYTAWWLQYDDHITIDGWDWRLNSLKNQHQYSMVNITAANMGDLKKYVSNIMKQLK